MITARITEPDIIEAAAYLGMGGDLSPSQLNLLEKCMENVVQSAQPKVIYKKIAVSDETFEALNISGDSIKMLLQNSEDAIIFAATIGLETDRLINRFQVQDMSQAVIMDACASAAIENVCNNFESDIKDILSVQGYSLTYRFSPGYGDLPISCQKPISLLLDTTKNIGLTVSDSMMMTPIKSVIAIMGITK